MPRARGSPWRPWTSRLGVSWAQDVIRDLSGSTAVHVPGIGHWVVPQSPCAQSVPASFLARPTAPDRARPRPTPVAWTISSPDRSPPPRNDVP
ncbi:alpha/beta hydrolase [Streptomyces sp. NPDC048340]|uniref:alpha/beta hydrolase n=1 Tax=Streptomyces sp. NPDC048340 TaxID=3365537 RepID=UPI0037103A6F